MRSFTCLISFLLFKLCSGQIQPMVVNSSGMLLVNNSYTFDIAIGEPIVNTLITGNYISTQGYLQPEINLTTQISFTGNITQIRCYPNPFNSILMIESGLNNLHFRIVDMTGKSIFEQDESGILDLAFLSSGLYNLVIYNKNNSLLAIEKICKI